MGDKVLCQDVLEQLLEEKVGRIFLLKLISKMSIGGDTDKVARLNDSEVLLAMRKKYGLE